MGDDPFLLLISPKLLRGLVGIPLCVLEFFGKPFPCLLERGNLQLQVVVGIGLGKGIGHGGRKVGIRGVEFDVEEPGVFCGHDLQRLGQLAGQPLPDVNLFLIPPEKNRIPCFCLIELLHYLGYLVQVEDVQCGLGDSLALDDFDLGIDICI